MAADLVVRGHDSRHEAHLEQVRQVDGVRTSPQDFLKYIVVPLQYRQDPSPESPAGLHKVVVMSVAAILTAVFLIYPAIPYLFSTFQTSGQLSDLLDAILHNVSP